MSDDLDREILRGGLAACATRIEGLRYSFEKTRQLFPLDVKSIGLLTEEQKESIDAMILRYSQCVSLIQDQIFRGIAIVEEEDLSDKSNRDKAALMEKFGVIKSASEFGEAVVLRNKFSHSYSEESEKQLARLNLLPCESGFLFELFDHLKEYVEQKNLLPRDRVRGYGLKG